MSLNKLSLVERAANLTTNKSELPNSAELVQALLALEKSAKKEISNNSLADLIGCWNLRLISPTPKTKERAKQILPIFANLGTARYIPQFIKIQLIYKQVPNCTLNTGRVENSVKLAFLNLSLTGPVKFMADKNILAFDFTSLNIKIFGFNVYDGYIKNGMKRDNEFYTNKINQQAFFSYFLLQKNLIAARGRGGGIALWGRASDQK